MKFFMSKITIVLITVFSLMFAACGSTISYKQSNLAITGDNITVDYSHGVMAIDAASAIKEALDKKAIDAKNAEESKPNVAPTTEATASVDNSIKGSTYVIQSGDTVSSVAARANTTVAEIARCNNIDVNNVTVGQTITLHCDTAPQPSQQASQSNQSNEQQPAPSKYAYSTYLPNPIFEPYFSQANVDAACRDNSWATTTTSKRDLSGFSNSVSALAHNVCGGSAIYILKVGDLVHIDGWGAGDWRVVNVMYNYFDDHFWDYGTPLYFKTCEPGTRGGHNRIVQLVRA